MLAGLAWFLLRTDVGIAVRAAAENEDRALLLGIPVRRLSTIVWMVAGGLASLTFVLKAPFSGVTPGITTAGPVVLLPALAAAVVARMESLPTAFIAGIGIGIMEQVVAWMCDAPARVWDLVGKGRIVEGYDADLVLVDLARTATIRDHEQVTKSGWSPWHGQTLQGWPVRTLVHGRTVFLDGRFDTSVRGAEAVYDHGRGGYWS